MRTALLLCAAALLLAGPAAAEFNLLDPSSWIDALSWQSKEVEKWHRPDFCGNSECPRFKVEDKTDNYEIRTYEKGKWAVTKVNDTKWELAYTKATARLMKYFKGGNEEGTSMELTTPTLGRLRPDEKMEKTERNYAFSYWIPEEYQKDTPQPTDADVKVKKYGRATVAVRVFSGFATESTILDNAKSLQELLDDDKQDFDSEEMFVAVYDPPQKLLNRHNEIHVPVSSKKKGTVQKWEQEVLPARA